MDRALVDVAYLLVVAAAWIVMCRRWGPALADEMFWPMATVLLVAAAVLWPLTLAGWALGRAGEWVARQP